MTSWLAMMVGGNHLFFNGDTSLVKEDPYPNLWRWTHHSLNYFHPTRGPGESIWNHKVLDFVKSGWGSRKCLPGIMATFKSTSFLQNWFESSRTINLHLGHIQWYSVHGKAGVQKCYIHWWDTKGQRWSLFPFPLGFWWPCFGGQLESLIESTNHSEIQNLITGGYYRLSVPEN